MTTLQGYRYIFLRKITGVAGTYVAENSTATPLTSPYAYIADNRTIQKATRNMYANVIPALNGPITLNADGTPADETVAYFTDLCSVPLDAMQNNGELSDFGVTISTTQNILATSKIIITVVLVEVGTGRNIVINIGYGVLSPTVS